MSPMVQPRDDLHLELGPPGDLGIQNPSIYIVHISSLREIVPIEDQNDEPVSLLPDQGATTVVNGCCCCWPDVDTSGIAVGHSARVSANGVAGGPAGVAASGLDGGQPADHSMLKANDTQKHVNPYHASSSGLSSTSMELCARGNSGEGISPESRRELESRGYPQDAIEVVNDNLLIGTDTLRAGLTVEEIERDMREMGGRASGGHAPNSLVEVGGNDVLTEQELSQMKVENKRMRDQLTCKICRCREACVVFIPCRHIRLCDVCCRSSARCDECHAAIETWMPIRPDGVCYP